MKNKEIIKEWLSVIGLGIVFGVLVAWGLIGNRFWYFIN
jgi:hypothetical protein